MIVSIIVIPVRAFWCSCRHSNKVLRLRPLSRIRITASSMPYSISMYCISMYSISIYIYIYIYIYMYMYIYIYIYTYLARSGGLV
jgi:hypothetical protein